MSQLSHCTQARFSRGLLTVAFVTVLRFPLVISLVSVALQHRAGVVAHVSKCKKAGTCLMKRVHVLEKLRSGKSYGAGGREFAVNESTWEARCVSTETHLKQGYILMR